MTDKRISELPAAAALAGTDVIPISQGTSTRKVTVATFDARWVPPPVVYPAHAATHADGGTDPIRGPLVLPAADALKVPLTVKGAAGQIGDLVQYTDDQGNLYGRVASAVSAGTTTFGYRCNDPGSAANYGARLIATKTPLQATAGSVDLVTQPAVFGGEVVANGTFTTSLASWTAGAGWAWAAGAAKHTTGNTGTLSQSLTLTANAVHRLSWTITGRTAGSVTITVGTATTPAQTASGQTLLTPGSTTPTITITPTTDFDGSVDDISVTIGSGTAGAPRPAKSSVINGVAGAVVGEERAYSTGIGIGLNAVRYGDVGSAPHVVGIGFQALSENLTGTNVTAVGSTAGQHSEGAAHGTFLGFAAGQNARYGADITAVGCNAFLNGSGGSCTAVGSAALINNTTGANNTAVGMLAGYQTTTGANNTVMGISAGQTITNGSANVCVGQGADVGSGAVSFGTVIGALTKVTANSTLALGYGTQANAAGAVAIGTDSGNASAIAANANDFVLGTALHNVKVPGSSIALGTNPAAAGAVRLPFNTVVGWRKSDNLTDSGYVGTVSDGTMQLGSGSGFNVALCPGGSTQYTFKSNQLIFGASVAALSFPTSGGTKIGGGATDRFAFWGANPTAQLTGTPAAAVDPATTMALANFLRTSMLTLGLVA